MDNQQGFFSRKLRAGKRRTYFFDVRSTKQGDYFLTVTESKRKFDRPGYDSHKIFVYKEDFNKFSEALTETINHIKTNLNPDFDYDSCDRSAYFENNKNEEKREDKREFKREDVIERELQAAQQKQAEQPVENKPVDDSSDEEIDKNAMEW